MSSPEPPLILFDAECVLCDRAVGFVARRDGGVHRFAALGSPAARRRLAADGAGGAVPATDSMVLLDAEGVWVRSDAVLRVARRMRRPWSWLAWLWWVPRPLRDAAYRAVAAVRGRAFGRGRAAGGGAGGGGRAWGGPRAARWGRPPAGLAERVLEGGLEAASPEERDRGRRPG